MRIAYKTPSGGVAIVHAAPKYDLEKVLGPLTDEQYRRHVRQRSIPANAVEVVDLPDDWEAPGHREYRNAWVLDGEKVEIDMPKAREVHREKLRVARVPLLATLDVAYQRADEAGDAAAKLAIAAEKQKWRDITDDPAIEEALTPEELKAAWPK